MLRWLLLLLTMVSVPGAAQLAPRPNAIQPELIADAKHRPVRENDLHHFFAMHFAAFFIG